MSNKTLTYMTFAVVAAIAILLILNVTNFLYTPSNNSKYISVGDVRGSAVFHAKKAYTLNFQQQNELINYINQSSPSGKVIPNVATPEIDKIVIYQFNNAPDIVVIPQGYIDDELIFSTPTWNANAQLRDRSKGQFKKFLSQTYDP